MTTICVGLMARRRSRFFVSVFSAIVSVDAEILTRYSCNLIAPLQWEAIVLSTTLNILKLWLRWII